MCFINLSMSRLSCLSCELENLCICFQVKVFVAAAGITGWVTLWILPLGIAEVLLGGHSSSPSCSTHTQVFLPILARNLMSLELSNTFFCSALQMVSGLCWRTEEQQNGDVKLHWPCWSVENFRVFLRFFFSSFSCLPWLLMEKVPLLFPIHHTIIQTVGAGSSPAPICTADLACYPAPPCLTALPWKMCILRLLTWINCL